jgi:hypothetical protein
MSNPIASIPFVKKKRRKAKAKEGAKFGAPAALAAAVAGVVALLLRRKKTAGSEPDVQAAATEVARQDADQATVASENGAGGADPLGASPDVAGTAPEGSVTPDTSADDPLVREETNAAADEAGSIGSDPDQPA